MSFRVDQGVELRLVATILTLNYVLNQFLDGSQRESDSESTTCSALNIEVDGYG